MATSVFSLHLKGVRFFGIHRHHPATIKTFFFGFFIGMIGCYKGFNAENGTASVGQAANSAVVTASLTIFIMIC
jgi:ABC-type transporter Mla maintaining outer membrane lipid asymmetry permease subunit MlaE